jgi:hypothetical protein
VKDDFGRTFGFPILLAEE